MGNRMSIWPTGYERRVFETLDSTLDEARRMLPVTVPTWILTHQQTQGRGRRGRPWVDVSGNFAASLVMPVSGPVGATAQRSFIVSLALYRAFIAVTGRGHNFALKWPNDVLLHGGKIAGILLESAGDHLIVGVGINLAQAPDAAAVEPGAVPPISLRGSMGLAVAPTDFLDHLAAEYAPLEEQFTRYGFGPIRRLWLDHAARLGEVITARTMRDEWIGVFEDIDHDGNLILATSEGRKVISAADIYFDQKGAS